MRSSSPTTSKSQRVRFTRAGASRTRLAGSGFTLIELLMVMAILTIVMAVIAPKLFNFATGRHINDEGTELVSMANYARTQSIAEGRPYRMNFGSDGSFWLTAPDDTGAFVDIKDADFNDHVAPPDGVTLDLGQIPRQTDGGVYVNFLPTGRCDPGTIVVRDNTGGTIIVTCQSPTELYHIPMPGAS
jgi:prepilin-type N-terminal cleavage/methylation domain-containing protein